LLHDAQLHEQARATSAANKVTTEHARAGGVKDQMKPAWQPSVGVGHGQRRGAVTTFSTVFKGAPSARRAVPALAGSVDERDALREFVRRRGVRRQELWRSGGAARRLRGGGPARDLWAVALRSRTPPPRRCPAPAGRRYRPQRSLSAAPARMAWPSFPRRAVSHRERSPSRARLRRVPASRRRPLTLIFPGKTSAPIRRTGEMCNTPLTTQAGF
jgi:hypothetical protein